MTALLLVSCVIIPAAAHADTTAPAASPTIRRVASGETFGVFVDRNGKARTWGSNKYGTLGLGTVDNTNQKEDNPATVMIPSKIVSVSAGPRNGFATDVNGDTWCWGYCGTSKLGASGTPKRINPNGVRFTVAQEISTYGTSSANHFVAASDDGQLWMWGGSNWMPYSINHYKETDTPLNVPLPDGIHVVGMGRGDTSDDLLLLSSNGDLYDYRMANVETFTKIASNVSKVTNLAWLMKDGSLHIDTRIAGNPIQMPAGITFTDVESSGGTLIATATDGDRYEWGYIRLMDYGDILEFDETNINNTSIQKKPLKLKTVILDEISMKDTGNATGGIAMAVAADKDGNIWYWGNSSSKGTGQITHTPQRVTGLTIPSGGQSTVITQSPVAGAPVADIMLPAGVFAGVALLGATLLIRRRRPAR